MPSAQFKVSDACEAAADLLGLANSGGLTIFAGAFASARGPSCLPTAADLKDAVVSALWDESRQRLTPRVGRPARHLLRGSRWPDVPLEMVAELVLERTQLAASQLLSFLGDASPNLNHAVLAAMLDRNLARLVTTNFDELIETQRLEPGDRRHLSKPHGTFSRPDEMTIRLSQVGRGIVTPAIRRSLERDLRGRDICFIGYSGRDLDIRPIFRTESIRSVLWIARPPLAGESSADVCRAHAYVAELFKSGTPVRCISVNANELFDELARRLLVSDRRSVGVRAWRDTLTSELRAVAWYRRAAAFGGVLGVSGRWDLARDVYGEIEVARVPSRDVAYAALNRMLASHRLQDYPDAKAAGRRAARRFRRLRDTQGLAQCYQRLGVIAERSSIRGSGWAVRYLKKSVELGASAPVTPAAIGAQLNLGTWLKNRGRFDEADAVQRTALRQARASGDLQNQMQIHLALGILRGTQRHDALANRDAVAACRLGASARYHLHHSLEAAAFLGNTSEELRSVNALVALELDSSLRRFRSGTADTLITKAEKLALITPEPDQRYYVATERGDWLNRVGRSLEAVAVLSWAVENAQSKAFVATALRERARAWLALRDADAAEADLVRALGLAPEGPHRESARRLPATARKMRQSGGLNRRRRAAHTRT